MGAKAVPPELLIAADAASLLRIAGRKLQLVGGAFMNHETARRGGGSAFATSAVTVAPTNSPFLVIGTWSGADCY